jgi:hypothetical protein
VYALAMVSMYYSLGDRISSIHSSRNFDYKIYNALHIFASGSSIVTPIAIALDVKKFVHYTSEWVTFQVGYV